MHSCKHPESYKYSPMDESSLGVHKIEFMIQTSPGLSNGSRVTQHANSPLHFGQVTSRNDSWWLVVDSHFEASRTPIDKLLVEET